MMIMNYEWLGNMALTYWHDLTCHLIIYNSIIMIYMIYNGWQICWLIVILVVYLPLWKMMDFVSWDDEILNWMGK